LPAGRDSREGQKGRRHRRGQQRSHQSQPPPFGRILGDYLRNRLIFSFWVLIFGRRRHHRLVSAATLCGDSIPALTFLGSYQSAHSTETLHLQSAIGKLQVAGPWLFTYLIHDDVALSSSLQLAVSSPAANKRQRSLGERAQTVLPPSAFCRSLPAGTHSLPVAYWERYRTCAESSLPI
jgi:hypothetical protein